MAAFNYQGRDISGKQVKGLLEGANMNAVAEQLTNKKIIVTSIKPAKSSSTDGIDVNNIDIADLLGFNAVSLDDLIILCRQMYALMRAGVPILRAINGLAESSNGEKLKKALSDVASQLEGGHALSSALHHHPKVFSPLFVSIVHVGENTGQLDSSFI